MLRNCLIIIALILLIGQVNAQEYKVLKSKKGSWKATINEAEGTLKSLVLKDGITIGFRNDSLSGPRFENAKLTLVDPKTLQFEGKNGDVEYSLRYKAIDDKLALVIGMKNTGRAIYAPKYERFFMGVNTEMVKYPEWNDILFPSLLRCEKTHFWGYLMSPNGAILSIGSPDPMASYTLHYELGPRGWGKHRIYSFSIDLLHQQPLPSRHPKQASLNPGEEKTWTIYLQEVVSLNDVKPMLAASLGVPMIQADQYSVLENKSASVEIYGKKLYKATLTSPKGEKKQLKLKTKGNKAIIDLQLTDGAGVYKLNVTDSKGHNSEANFSQLKPYSWYMTQARTEAIRNGQHASSHLEQWLGLTSGVNASRHTPNTDEDFIMEAQLLKVLALQWDLEKKIPVNIPHKMRYMSNTAQMAGLLAQKYLQKKEIKWLELASGFADYVMTCQKPDGYYSENPDLNTIYTSVFYPAKSLMTVMASEKIASETDSIWLAAYNRHYKSVKKAMDHLVHVGDNIDTEGQNTYEDGMIACSANQLGLFALLQKDTIQRDIYKNAALHFLKGHRCLEQVLIPDSRMNGASLRFWEAQYDILVRGKMNMMNSPHGWSAWTTPALWYQYLLSGDEEWLYKTINSLGSCVQVINEKNGELRWGFIVDPYLEATVLVEDPEGKGRGKRVKQIIGEDYMPMISSFHFPDCEPISGNSELVGWTCDNDVHEIFIAMEEIALTSCYLLQQENGELITWNCSVTSDKVSGKLMVTPNEDVVSRIHVNLKQRESVNIRFKGDKIVSFDCEPGMQWIGPGGSPELLR